MKAHSATYRDSVGYMGVHSVSLETVSGSSRSGPLDFEEGTLDFDRTADIHANGSVTVIDTQRHHAYDVLPVTTGDLFEPLINEFQIRRGLWLRPGGVKTLEDFSQGVYVVSDATPFESSDGSAGTKVELADRSYNLRRKALKPFSLSKGGFWPDAIAALIRFVYPAAQFAPGWPTSTTVGASDALVTHPAISLAVGDAPDRTCLDGAGALGRDLTLDDQGRFVLRKLPNVQVGKPVFEFRDGVNCTTFDTSKALKQDRRFNAVIVKPKGGGKFTGEAHDQRPGSKTHVDRIGYWPKPIDGNVASKEQADALAEVELGKCLSGLEEITFSCVADGTLEEADLVYFEKERLGIAGVYLINRIGAQLNQTDHYQVTVGK